MPKDIEKNLSPLVILWIVAYLKLDTVFQFCSLRFVISALLFAFVLYAVRLSPAFFLISAPTNMQWKNIPIPRFMAMNSHVAFTLWGAKTEKTLELSF